ncbi:MAG TPA: oligoendopeptidase F, partial [Candidatus Dormibacteraeota bacterium]
MAQATKTTGAEQVRWDLSDLFKSPTDPAIETSLADALKRARDFEARFKGRVVALPPKEFAAMMRELEEDEELAAKPEVYAFLLHSQNTDDHAAGRLLARVREASAERGRHGVFFTLELAQISDEQAEQLYADPDSARYRHFVEEARKFRPHQLTEPEERVLTDFSPVGNAAWNRLFEELCARIRVDLDGQPHPLEEALVRLREADRKVRRDANAAISRALQADVKTRAYIFNVILGEKAIDDRLRHFPTWISSRNLSN